MLIDALLPISYNMQYYPICHEYYLKQLKITKQSTQRMQTGKNVNCHAHKHTHTHTQTREHLEKSQTMFAEN